MSLLIYRGPDFLLAVVSCWLGLSLLFRAPRDRTAQVFAWFCLTLTAYGITGLVPWLTNDDTIAALFDRWQLIASVITTSAFLHFVTVLIATGRIPRVRYILIGLFYITGLLLAGYAASANIAVAEPGPLRSEPRFPNNVYLLSVAQVMLPLVVALLWMWRDYRRAINDAADRRLRRLFFTTSSIGVVGAVVAIGARVLPQSFAEISIAGVTIYGLHGLHAISRCLILVAMIVLTYAVLSLRALLPKRIARRTFLYSMIGSCTTAAYVGSLALIEVRTRDWLGVDLPLVTVFALVLLVASLGPLREWARGELDRRFYKREFDYGRLVQTLSADLLERGDLHEQLQAALSAICRALGIRDGLVAIARPKEELVVRASHGAAPLTLATTRMVVPADLEWGGEAWEPWPAAQFVLPLQCGDECLGVMALGARRSNQMLTPVEQGVLDYLGRYLALAILYEQSRIAESARLADLARQSEDLQTQRAKVAAALEAVPVRDAPTLTEGLHVYALGALRVEQHGEPITRWGGDKAGTNQAEALFAFLFDQRGKGITKEDMIEVIWPDATMEDTKRTDNAFHRTLTGLRRTLEPDLKHASKSQSIRFHHARYWFEPGMITWSDVAAFDEAVTRGTTLFHQSASAEALEALKQAVQLYRGDYMDDCPFFGDSIFVEEERQRLLMRYAEAQVYLSALYELHAMMGEAKTALQEAEAAQQRVRVINPEVGQSNLDAQRQSLLRGWETGVGS